MSPAAQSCAPRQGIGPGGEAMSIGFCIRSDGSAVEFHLSGRRRSNGLLHFRREPGYAVTLLGRLRYRADLAAGLGLDPGERDGLDDAGLVLAAYRRQGASGLARLEGTFALAVWDDGAPILVQQT